MNKFKINFFTCCDYKYSQFASLFALSSLFHNEDSVVEIGFDSEESVSKIKLEIDYINSIYKNRFYFKIVNFKSIILNNEEYFLCPNVVRFINEPSIKADYVYISDIDIICLEKDICNMHINNMQKNNLQFSNIVRDKSVLLKKLTGLHFTPWENYYPIKNYDNLISERLLEYHRGIPFDEIFLYRLIKERGISINEDIKYRPVHGIHASPNREPNGEKISWGMKDWKNNWIEFRKTKEFLGLEKILSDKIKNNILTIDNYFKIK